MMMFYRKAVLLGVVLVAGATIVACSKSANTTADTAGVKEVAGHSHEGWWCNEHGVPEEICAQCSPKLVADFKAKNDWCEKHNRPDSQCFVCHPEKEAEYAALYEAKYGKQPPKREAEGGEQEKDAAPKAT
jgi:cobalt-zinc-cadmium efflux system membrane fusion protein